MSLLIAVILLCLSVVKIEAGLSGVTAHETDRLPPWLCKSACWGFYAICNGCASGCEGDPDCAAVCMNTCNEALDECLAGC